LWLVCPGPARDNYHGWRERIDLDREPSRTINVSGLGVSQYWLEDDGIEREREMTDKPLYRVPSMAEIAAVPWNGYRIVSTFSGCGGSCLGFKMAGFKVIWASEFIPAAQETYRANHPGTTLDTRDIRQVQPEDILAATGLTVGELDVFEGSPPCASFSTAGKREAGWGKVKNYSDTKQRTDDLFFEYARLLKGLQPKTFIAENVSGLVKGKAKGYFKEILAALKACGYRVGAQLLDAQWLGVPQMRQRIIFQGVREDLDVAPAFPKPLPYRYSVREAIPWIVRHGNAPPHKDWVKAERDVGQFMVESDQYPNPTILQSGLNKASGVVEAECDISRYAIGREWDKLEPGEQSKKYYQLVRAPLDGPSPCVTQSAGTAWSPAAAAGVTHPTERRKFSIAELRRICAFPDDFVLTGSYAQQWERLGRAVPPVMMYHIAKTLRDEVLARV